MQHANRRYSPTELVRLRGLIEIKVREALEEFAQTPFHQRVLSHTINHTGLMPDGDALDIHLRLELHDKKKVQPPTETS